MDVEKIPSLKETYNMIPTIILSIISYTADDELINRLLRERKDVEVRKTICRNATVQVFEHVIDEMNSHSRKLFRPDLLTTMHMFGYVRDILLLILENDTDMHTSIYAVARSNGLSLDECEIVSSAVYQIRMQLIEEVSCELKCLLSASSKWKFNETDFRKCCVDHEYHSGIYQNTLKWLMTGFNSPYISD